MYLSVDSSFEEPKRALVSLYIIQRKCVQCQSEMRVSAFSAQTTLSKG